MKELGILFKGPLVRALLNTRPGSLPAEPIDPSKPFKWQTRRIVDPQWPCGAHPKEHSAAPGTFIPYNDQGQLMNGFQGSRKGDCAVIPPYGPVGRRLWVRETWCSMCRVAEPFCYCKDPEQEARNHYIEYRADTDNPYPGEWPEGEELSKERPTWKPSIHMFRKHSRIDLEVTDVRVQRLQEITEEDAIAEGFVFTDWGMDKWGNQLPGWHVGAAKNEDQCLGSARFAFGNLWNKINAPRGYSWESNPWVFAYSFKVLEVKNG